MAAFSVFKVLANLVTPVTKLIGEMHTSEEEKLTLRNALAGMQNTISMAYLEYESEILKSKASIIMAEAQGGSWIQRNWRPVTMLTFLLLVVMDSFGWLASPLADEAWVLLQIGLGGYVVGRSAEKVVPKLLGK